MARDDPRAVDIALRDGSSVRLRPIRAGDEAALLAFLQSLDPDDRYLRFFSGGVNLRAVAEEAAQVDDRDRFGLVAVGDDDRTILGHGCAVRDAPGAVEAEVAFAVDERLRGEGIATAMLAHLAQAAGGAGVRWLTAVVLPRNSAMIEVFRESGLRPSVEAATNELRVRMPAALGPEALEAFDRRDGEAAAAAVAHVLAPRSVAVIGASDRQGSIGGAVLSNLVAAGFTGRLHAVNPRRPVVAGIESVAALGDIAEPVELAVIAIPAAAVVGAARECARHGVRALVVISDGFGESGPEGRERQHELVTVCRRSGMRLVGPNCLGVMSTDPAVRLNASFAPQHPPEGRVAFLSQSGALAIAAVDTARERGLGLSSFVSVGDKADLSGNDFLAYWERDPRTAVVLLYLESFGNPRKFARVARRVARTKPIVVVKGGRSAAGLQAAGSHTGALLSGSDATVQALFEQAGVIPTDTLGELFDVAALLADQPPPAGLRVGIVTNGGGLGILCADACAAAGLDVVELPADVQRGIAAAVARGAALRNPIDLLAAATPEDFEHAIGEMADSGAVDAVIAIYVPPMVSQPAAVAAAIRRAAARAGVPVAAVLAMAQAPSGEPAVGEARVPTFRLPENAAHAVARAARYGAWRASSPQDEAGVAGDVGAAGTVIAGALARADGWLEPGEIAALLDAYGIPRPAQRLVSTGRAAARAAHEVGFPVALKAVAPGLVHRTDAGAVTTGLSSTTAVLREAAAMRARVAAAGLAPSGFLVQAMAPPGVEMLVGVVADPTFGPVVACAAGGTSAELLGDSVVRLTPLGRRRAEEMIRSLRTFPLLDGYRGAPRCDVDALVELVVRLAALADAHPEIAELECNPVIAGPDGVLAVDARARVRPAPVRLPEPALRPA